MEVAVLVHIRAIPHCRPIKVYFFDQTAPHQKIQTVVDRCHRDVGQIFFGPHEHLFRGGMIALLEQHPIDVLPLRRQTKAFKGEALHQGRFDCFGQALHGVNLSPFSEAINIWNNSKSY